VRVPPSGQAAIVSPSGRGADFDRLTTSAPVRLSLQLSQQAIASLRRDPRRNVDGVLRESGKTYRDVAVHLKGSTGSFRPLGQKPSLTVTLDRYRPEQDFHGVSKIHLNNSVEDPSYLNERIGAELFMRASLPAPRVTWAVLEINGEAQGLYVLKEGFTRGFLERHFGRPVGTLYEGSGSDLGQPMSRDVFDVEEDRAMSTAALALGESNKDTQWDMLTRAVDMDRFVLFMAMEMLIGHRDGYCLARNNYRIYSQPREGKLIFLPHGMDQLFGRPDATITPTFAGRLAEAVRTSPIGARHYRERLEELTRDFFRAEELIGLVDEWVGRLCSVLEAKDARSLKEAAEDTKSRMLARKEYLVKRLAHPDPKPLAFATGQEKLTNWVATDIPAGGRLEVALSPEGKPALKIEAGPTTMASWRCRELLPPGRYQFEALVATAGVRPPQTGRNRGAGIRVSGVQPLAPHNLVGDNAARLLTVSFEVGGEAREVEMICELRAVAGRAWFELESLRLKRLQVE